MDQKELDRLLEIARKLLDKLAPRVVVTPTGPMAIARGEEGLRQERFDRCPLCGIQLRHPSVVGETWKDIWFYHLTLDHRRTVSEATSIYDKMAPAEGKEPKCYARP